MIFAFASAQAMYSTDARVYIDEFTHQEDSFYAHLGENIWVPTQHLACDDTGIFTYKRSIYQLDKEITKKWKCPYCHRLWPVGVACQNPDCPSKYK
jgi:hypothetical protein